MDDREQVVTVKLKGLDDNSLYRVAATTLADFPDEGCFIAGSDNGHGVMVPDPDQIAAVFAGSLVTTENTVGTSPEGGVSFPVTLPARGVVRVGISGRVVSNAS